MAFGLPGVHALGLWKALEDSGMRYVGFRHEQAAAHAADGYGRATGRPGAVFLSTGPGTLNALSAIGEAYVASSPLLAVASSIPSNFVGRAKGYLHEVKDLAPAFDAVTRYRARAASVEDVPEMMERALAAAMAGRPGPALLEVPADLFDAELEASATVPSFERKAAPPEGIEEGASLLALAARPVIWAGGGVIRSRASDELLRVAETLQAPVITTFMGKGAIPETHPLAVGTLVRQPEAADLLRDADLLLSVGSRFSGMATSNWKLELPSQHIQIDVDPEELGRNYPLRLGIEADAGAALAALADALGGKIPPDSAPAREVHGARAAAVRRAAFDRARAEGPRETAMLDAVRQAIDDEVVVVHDMTVPSYWAAPFFEVRVANTFHYPYGFGSLGFSFPAAIGIAAADRSRPVVSFSGDGGFQYHSRELATVVEHDLPVVAIVFNDRAWGVLKSFGRARYESTFGLDLPGPDFLALASAFGVPATRASEPEELQKAVFEAVASGAPRLIEVPGAWALPPPSGYYRR